jgi:hypothetical protein
MSDIDLPRSPDRESCPRPHLKQKQRIGYAICRLETWPREVKVQVREYCLPPVIAVLRYIEHVIKKCQVHRRHLVCTVIQEYHEPEQIQAKLSCIPTKKISTLVYLQNKFTDGVKFLVKIIPSDGLVIGVRRQLLKIFSQTWELDTKCRELNVLILFSPIYYLKWPRAIGDVVITVWIDIQSKEHLHRHIPFIASHPLLLVFLYFSYLKIRLVNFKIKYKITY